MKNYKVEKDFIVDGFRCVILGIYMGHRCGYIAIPKGHKLYGKDYDEIDISVHGGLTYAEYSENSYPVECEEPVYWIGFDCAHAGDGKDFELIKSFLGKNDDVQMILDIEAIYPMRGIIRTLEYVENELIDVVRQLKEGEF